MGRRLRGCAMAGLLACVFLSCGDDDETSDGGGSPTPPSVTPSPPPSACPPDHRKELAVDASPQELPYVGLITACTNALAETTVLVNKSEVVWSIDSTIPADVTQLHEGSSLEFDSFQALARETYESALMFPNSSVLIDVPPDNVSWYIHGPLSASWVIHHRFSETFTDQYGDVALEVFLPSSRSKGRAALAACVRTIWDLSGTDLEKLTGPDPFERLVEGLEAASSTSRCGSALVTAQDDYARRMGSEAGDWAARIRTMSNDVNFMSKGATLTDDFLDLVRIAISAR